MISKKDIKEYDFNTIQDYYEYIVESIINGQRTQARNLIKDLSKAQRAEAYYHLKNSSPWANTEPNTEALELIIMNALFEG